MRTGLLGLIILLASLALGACASNGQRPSGQPDEAVLPPFNIAGLWRVESIESVDGATRLAAPSERGAKGPTLQFDPVVGAAGGRLAIDTGVNRGTAHYVFTPGERDVGAIAIERIAITRMAGPADAMEFEGELVDALGQARTAKRTAEGVTVDCGDTRVLLVK